MNEKNKGILKNFHVARLFNGIERNFFMMRINVKKINSWKEIFKQLIVCEKGNRRK